MAHALANAATLLRNPSIAVAYAHWRASPSLALPWGDRISGFRSFSEYMSGKVCTPSPGEIAFIRHALANGGVALDVGANLGILSLLMANAGASEVHAFEPAPGTACILKANTAHRQKIECHTRALSERVGSALFTDKPGDSATNSLANGDTDAPTVRVETDTIDAFCARKGIERVSFIKIDVEGFEPQVLSGALGMFCERRIGMAMIEVVPRALEDVGSSVGALATVLDRTGYVLRGIRPDGMLGDTIDLEATGSVYNYALAPA